MATCKAIPLQLSEPSKLQGIIYLFEKAGDELQVHTHDAITNHVTIISNGSFRCRGNPKIEGKVLEPGQVIDWPLGEPHGFVALSDGAKMIQLLKTY